jgi:methionyl-tRNA formyltransferase
MWSGSSPSRGSFASRIRAISDRASAQTRPYPGAFTVIEGKRVTIWSADVVPVADKEDALHPLMQEKDDEVFARGVSGSH